MTDKEIKRLVKRSQRKNKKAFSKLYDYYYDRLFYFILGRVKNRDLAQDIVSETFFKMLENIETFEWRNAHSFNGWVFTIAHNEMYKLIRRNKKNVASSGNSLVETIVDEHANSELETDSALSRSFLYEIIFETVQKLKPLYQDILHLRFTKELPLKDIAIELEMKESTIRVYLQRALQELKSLLKANPQFHLHAV